MDELKVMFARPDDRGGPEEIGDVNTNEQAEVLRRRETTKRRRMGYRAVALLGLVLVGVEARPEPVDRDQVVRQLLPKQITQLKMKSPLMARANVDPSLLHAIGIQEVIIKLKSPPVVNEKTVEGRISRKAMLKSEQTAFMERTGMSSKEITCVQTLMNGVFLKIDATEVAGLAADEDVESIHRVRNYQMHLSETVPYVGATTVQNRGYDGTGVRVAVLDSGIDYTHAAFGGGGTIASYGAAYEDPDNRDASFPTNKVVEGYDFVGETWPAGGDLVPDDDPIDSQGHGTAVADIIRAVAPGVSLYAVKVCSPSGAGGCSGVALMQGIEYAIDPNGDGDISDAVDIVNLSLGTPYGTPYDDDLSQAINAASDLGVLVVAAAGNDGDKPYISATSGSAQSALSVAQTQVPSATVQLLEVNGVDYRAVFQPWSQELDSVITGPIQYGDGQGENLDGCDDFALGSILGKVVLVDRGECNFTLKIQKIAEGGGLAGIIGLIDEVDPFLGGDGGDRPTGVPGYMISQADADAIKDTGIDTIVTLDPVNVRSLVKSMAPSSSRGPQHQEDTQLIKPEIGAPGASVAAVAGSGTDTAPFGGTSGSAPVIAGAAALLLERYPDLEPHEVKARLMNNGETGITTDPFNGLAPITRIGGGEVQVDRALTARAAAWDEVTKQGALSFGFVDVFKETEKLYKRIRVRNYSYDDIMYTVTPTFRYTDDEASGAVTLSTSFPEEQIQVPAGQDRIIDITMTIKGDLLPGNYMNCGEDGGSGDALTKNEFDGYFILDDGVQPIHMAWHVLPRKAANVTLGTSILDFSSANPSTVDVVNNGVGDAQIDSFSLLAVSDDLPEGTAGAANPTPDIKAVGIRTLEDEDDVCSETNAFVWAFAISTWERQQHLFPVSLKIFLDVDQDGEDDFLVTNSDISENPLSSLDGRQAAFALNLNTGEYSSVFFVDHSTNTGNTVLYVCAEQLGLDETDLLSTNIDMEVYTQDILYNGDDDKILGLIVTPGAERFNATTEDLGPGAQGTLTVSDVGAFDGNSPEHGVMLITNGNRGAGKGGGATEESELLLLRV